MTFFSKHTNEWAVAEWEAFAEKLQRGILEWYDYWQDLSMRESFDNGERKLSDELRSRVEKADAIVRQQLILVLKQEQRLNEYRNIARDIPKKYWWWHLEDKEQ